MLDLPEFDQRDLRDAFGCFAAGVTVVSLCDPAGRPAGVTVSSFSSLSLSPPLCLFSLGKEKISAKWLAESRSFAVNVLAAGQEEIAWRFARPSDDKFAGLDWAEGRNGAPVLEGCRARFECDLWNIYDGGDHVIVVGRITDMAKSEGGALVFYRGQMTAVAC